MPPGRPSDKVGPVDIARWVFAKLAVIAGRNAASTGGNAILLRRFGRLGTVKSGARRLNTRGVLDSPLPERRNRDQEVAAKIGKGVVNTRLSSGGNGTADKPVTLQVSEAQCEHTLGNAADDPLNFIEPSGPLSEPLNDQDTPFVANTAQYAADRPTIIGAKIGNTAVT